MFGAAMGTPEKGMCDGRCIWLLDDDGILSAYRETVKPANLFWASRGRPVHDEFLLRRAYSNDICPILEFPASITFHLQLGKRSKQLLRKLCITRGLIKLLWLLEMLGSL